MSKENVLLSTLVNYSATNLIQRQISPRIIGYIYTKIISPIENIVLRIPYGSSGNSFKKNHKVSPGVAEHLNKLFWWNIRLLHTNIFIVFDSDVHTLFALGKSNGNSTYPANRQCGEIIVCPLLLLGVIYLSLCPIRKVYSILV